MKKRNDHDVTSDKIRRFERAKQSSIIFWRMKEMGLAGTTGGTMFGKWRRVGFTTEQMLEMLDALPKNHRSIDDPWESSLDCDPTQE